MKKFLLILLPLLFIGCNNTIPYELRNHTNYDVTLIDVNNINHPEYFIEANTTITIEHTNNGHFKLKNNTYPIEVYDGFVFTAIKNLNTYSLTVINNSDKQFELIIKNTTHVSTANFTISTDKEQSINIYCNSKPEIELYFNKNTYNNFIIKDNIIIIY